ncbi:MAG: spore maturation protein [Clostridia bacterium]|nr:spore maturation protein [Clostridia bacterium]
MTILNKISAFTLPFIILIFALILGSRKKDYTSVFINGAKEGICSSFNILPSLCLLVVGVSMLSSSGAINILSKILDPVFTFLKIPTELLPLIITRPLSSGASIASYESLIENSGIDSFASICGAVIMSSSDTAFYVISVYFSSTGIKKTRHALPCAILSSVLCIFLSCILCRLFFE